MSLNNNGFDASKIAAVAQLFSSRVLKELARKGRSPIFSRLLKESGMTNAISSSDSVGHLFEMAFAVLRQPNNRHEYVYKAAIAHKILLGTHSLKTASMMTEFRVCGCKADVAIINGTSTVYEIKSERDNLDKLVRQIEAYRKFFASVNVIAGENHLAEISDSLPSDVGIMVLSDRYQISTIREATDDPSRVVPEVVFDSLQLSESRQVLDIYGISIPKVPNTQMYQELRERFLTLSSSQVHDGVVKVLKETRNQRALADLSDSLPEALRAAVFAMPLRLQDRDRLKNVMDTPISEALLWG